MKINQLKQSSIESFIRQELAVEPGCDDADFPGQLAHTEDIKADTIAVHYGLWIAPNMDDIRGDLDKVELAQVEQAIVTGNMWAWGLQTCRVSVSGWKEAEGVFGEVTAGGGVYGGLQDYLSTPGSWSELKIAAMERLKDQVIENRIRMRQPEFETCDMQLVAKAMVAETIEETRGRRQLRLMRDQGLVH